MSWCPSAGVSASSSSDIIRRFFFQAEDGIRDVAVTGVQTCALPIFLHETTPAPQDKLGENRFFAAREGGGSHRLIQEGDCKERAGPPIALTFNLFRPQIGRASCRERV